MSQYGPSDSYGQPNPDPYQPPPPSPFDGGFNATSGSTSNNGGYPDDPYQQQSPGYAPPGGSDPYSAPPADPYQQPATAPYPAGPGPYSPPISGPGYGRPPVSGGPQYNPAGPAPAPAPGYVPVPPPSSGNNTGLWVLGGIGGLVLVLAIVLVGVFVIGNDGDDGITTTDGSTTSAPTDPVTTENPTTAPPTTEQPSADPFAGYAENDAIRGEVGDCVYAYTDSTDTYQAELVPCDDSTANAYFYDIAYGTLDENDCPDSDYGKVQFWYWVDFPDSTIDDYVLCGYWIAK